jgi:hypothetical protein
MSVQDHRYAQAANMGALKAPLVAAAGAFILFPADEGFRPAGGGGFEPMRQQAVTDAAPWRVAAKCQGSS